MARTRTVQTCEACRKAKVRCDRAKPQCSRCLKANRDCSYLAEDATSSLESSSTSYTALSDPASPDQIDAWLADLNGATSTAGSEASETLGSIGASNSNENTPPSTALACTKLHSLTEAGPQHWVSRRRKRNTITCVRCRRMKMERLYSPSCSRNKRLIPDDENDFPESTWSPNYPFGERPRRSKSTRKAMLASIPSREVADKFVEAYLDVIETSHRILHVPTLKLQIQAFWCQPSAADDGWLAQYFTILALGCDACRAEASDATEPYTKLRHTLLTAAETCLRLTPFLYRPTLANLRTLCLMVIAKQIHTMSCSEHEACWPLTGLIVRLAMMVGMHSSSSNKVYSPFHAEMRNRLWAVICFMDLKQSLLSGMPLQITTETFTCFAPANINEDEIHESFNGEILSRLLPERTDSTVLVVLHDVFPLVADIMRMVNSADGSLQYEDVLEYDSQIRFKMKEYEVIFQASPKCLTESAELSSGLGNSSIDPARILLNVYFRRILLTLHSYFAKLPQAFIEYPVAYWSSLECSLALLAQQRELCEQAAHNRGISTWFSRLFKQDFFTAAMTLCFHLIKDDSPLELPAEHLCQIQARETVLETLRSCRDLWGKDKDLSNCHDRACQLVTDLVHHFEETI
ncbi:conserved hypothetical protein [Microsporum canis CBS 113480]|uniref:C6 finger domain transcription factor nscR n=1 Tax=Arthroderma otae (strain ATCC MYA-4605 / CBS 113480) TaxID=554155 RepID=C5FM56_ARTOC|nr:conserved hypothetical protein [Microsporum canis CBS 113480]EEQ30778.1 conserved hypothetical protein [Microsporum canis CBS 113480]